MAAAVSADTAGGVVRDRRRSAARAGSGSLQTSIEASRHARIGTQTLISRAMSGGPAQMHVLVLW